MSEAVHVVGGGLSGLALGYALQRRGREVVVHEAGEHAGGLLGSHQVDGFLLEDAANSFIDREPLTREVMGSLGLNERVVPAAPAAKRRFLFTRGALHELPAAPPKFLRSSVLPWSAKLRAAMEPFSRRGKAGEDESLASFMRRHLGSRVTSSIVDAMQLGIYAGDPEQLSVGATFPKLRALEDAHRSLFLGTVRAAKAAAKVTPHEDLTRTTCTFQGGMAELPRALAQKLGSSVRLRSAVSELRASRGGWSFSAGGAATEARHLVLATPSYVSAELVRGVAPEVATELAAVKYAPIAAVHLGFAPGAISSQPEGFGALIPDEEKQPVLGVIFVSSVFPFRAPQGSTLLTCLVGGARHPELLAGSDEEILQRTCDTLNHVLGLRGTPTLTRVTRWARGIPQYEVGHLARMERLRLALARYPGLHVVGNAYQGVGVHDCLRGAQQLAEAL